MARWRILTLLTLFPRLLSRGTAFLKLRNAALTASTLLLSLAFRFSTKCAGFSLWGMCLYADFFFDFYCLNYCRSYHQMMAIATFLPVDWQRPYTRSSWLNSIPCTNTTYNHGANKCCCPPPEKNARLASGLRPQQLNLLSLVVHHHNEVRVLHLGSCYSRAPCWVQAKLSERVYVVCPKTVG